MKFTKKFIKSILVKYYLFKTIDKIKEFDTGWTNYSFYIETNNKKFVLQIMGKPISERLINNLTLQINALNHLKKNKYPYNIPNPLLNVNGEYLSIYKNRCFFIYEYIEGDWVKRFTEKSFREYAKALAIYTKIMDKFPYKGNDSFNFGWIKSEYQRITKEKAKNKLDKLIHSNIHLINTALDEIEKIKDYGRLKVIHSDFNRTNVLFSKGKLTGIIDFHNIETAPISKELGIAISRNKYLNRGYSKKKEKIFLNEFEKVYPLKEIERKSIVPALLRDVLIVIWWKYLKMEKNRDTAYEQIQREIYNLKKYSKLYQQFN